MQSIRWYLATARPQFPPFLRYTPSLSIRKIATQSYNHFEKAVSIIRSNVDTSSAEYRQNVAQMTEVTDSLRALHERIKLGGGEKIRHKHIARKKMLPRE